MNNVEYVATYVKYVELRMRSKQCIVITAVEKQCPATQWELTHVQIALITTEFYMSNLISK